MDEFDCVGNVRRYLYRHEAGTAVRVGPKKPQGSRSQDLVRRYEELCRLHRQVQILSENLRNR
jgi:hypothetical protein